MFDATHGNILAYKEDKPILKELLQTFPAEGDEARKELAKRFFQWTIAFPKFCGPECVSIQQDDDRYVNGVTSVGVGASRNGNAALHGANVVSSSTQGHAPMIANRDIESGEELIEGYAEDDLESFPPWILELKQEILGDDRSLR